MKKFLAICLGIATLSSCDLTPFVKLPERPPPTAEEKAHLEWSFKRVEEWTQSDAFAALIVDEFSGSKQLIPDGQRGYSEGFDRDDIISVAFGGVKLESRTDQINGVRQTLTTRYPVSKLTKDWFLTHRDTIAYGYPVDWDNDADPAPLVYEYWVPEEGWNVRVKLTMRPDGTIEQLVFTNPN